jgi:hypothetical protein
MGNHRLSRQPVEAGPKRPRSPRQPDVPVIHGQQPKPYRTAHPQIAIVYGDLLCNICSSEARIRLLGGFAPPSPHRSQRFAKAVEAYD